MWGSTSKPRSESTQNTSPSWSREAQAARDAARSEREAKAKRKGSK
ncbi:hypothetical protein [Streptomyces hydrogenans]